MHGYFITGTDTGVGKTVVTAALARQLLCNKAPVRVIKPVQTGCLEDDDMEFCRKTASEFGDLSTETLFRFVPPTSPHLAAREAGVSITVDEIESRIGEFDGITLIEGAGGLLVPLNDEETMLDLIERLKLPVILVLANRLGAINHTLLSLEALHNRGIEVFCVVFNHLSPCENEQEDIIQSENPAIIIKRTDAKYSAFMPYNPAPVHSEEWCKRLDFFSRSLVWQMTKLNIRSKLDPWPGFLELDSKHIWHPYTSAAKPLPVYPIESAHGCILKTPDGKELIDGMSSWWCAIHGYNHPRLNRAIREQLLKVSHVMFGGITHAPAVKLTREILKIVPDNLQHVFFSDSGSVAVEIALKMALQYQQAKGETARKKFLSVRGGYFGDTFAAMSVCDPVNGMHTLFTDFLPEQIFVPRPECRFDSPFDPETLKPLEETFEKHAENLAGAIIEPIVQGAGGMWFYHPEYLRGLRDLCDEYKVPLILDEIATGFGRTGKIFASHWAGIKPDIMCIGKALTGGMMTLAATLASPEIALGISENGGVFMHGPTFMANPLACSVALASLELLEKNDWKENVSNIKSQLKQELESCRNHPEVADVRVLGAIGVLEMKRPINTAKLQEFFVRKGVWIRPFGKLLYLMPPYVIESEQLSKLCGAVRDSLT